MATRYEGENGEPDLEIVDFIPDKSDKSPIHALLATLLIWNETDTVDDFEQNRNNIIYSYQHNRNPFIDHPEYINRIWTGDSTLGTNPITKIDLPIIYPNPARDFINIKD